MDKGADANIKLGTEDGEGSDEDEEGECECNCCECFCGDTPLQIAVRRGDLPLVKLLRLFSIILTLPPCCVEPSAASEPANTSYYYAFAITLR